MKNIGLKRVCMFCGTKFYDFNKEEIICPKCGEVFDQNVLFKRRMKTKDVEDEITIDSLGLSDDIEIDDNDDGLILDDVDDKEDVHESSVSDSEE